MTIQVDNALPPNVVEIGNEITQGVVDGLMSSSPSASSSNPYVTVNGVSGVYLPLAGGTMTGDIGVNYNDLNQVTSIVFADSTVQTTAPVGAGTWGSITGTLSSQTDLQNALNTKLTASSNLSDLANAGTARTNLGVEYATDAEVIAGTSASKVLSPSNGQQLRPIYDYGFYDLGSYNWSSASTGGFFVQSGSNLGKFVNTNTAIGYGVFYFSVLSASRSSGNGNSLINWSKRVVLSTRMAFSNPSSTNTTHRFMLGKSTASTVAGDLAIRGIGVKRTGAGALTLMVHDGTNLSTSATSFTPTNATTFDLTLVSDGAGTTTCYINGSSVGSITGSPTTIGSGNNSGIFGESENTATVTSSGQIYTTNIRLSLGI